MIFQAYIASPSCSKRTCSHAALSHGGALRTTRERGSTSNSQRVFAPLNFPSTKYRTWVATLAMSLLYVWHIDHNSYGARSLVYGTWVRTFTISHPWCMARGSVLAISLLSYAHMDHNNYNFLILMYGVWVHNTFYFPPLVYGTWVSTLIIFPYWCMARGSFFAISRS